MGTFSVWHWLVVLVVIVLLFGSKKIPELAKGVANGIKTFKKEIKDDEAEKIEEKKDTNEEKRV
ncbi:MAG: twin-arginine translocase TatA/TatE family subunit [Campylobacter sp.]